MLSVEIKSYDEFVLSLGGDQFFSSEQLMYLFLILIKKEQSPYLRQILSGIRKSYKHIH